MNGGQILAISGPAAASACTAAVCVTVHKAVARLTSAYQVVTVSAKPQPPQKPAEPLPAGFPLPPGPFPSVPRAAAEPAPELATGGAG